MYFNKPLEISLNNSIFIIALSGPLIIIQLNIIIVNCVTRQILNYMYIVCVYILQKLQNIIKVVTIYICIHIYHVLFYKLFWNLI